MKLKLKNPGLAAPADAPANGGQSASASSTPAAAAPKLNLKIKSAVPSGAPVAGSNDEPPKPKRKYVKKPKVDDNGQPVPNAKTGPKPKKRPLEDGEEGAPAKRKSKPTLKSLERAQDSDEDDDTIAVCPVRAPAAVPRPNPARTQSVKISLKPKGPGQVQRSGTAILKMKAPGKAPSRPPGVGYDSEAEEAEEDPAIEAQFVLRMEPGADCDLLRKSIEEKTIGKKPAEGGAQVRFRFLDRDGRRTIITIQDRMYAATMVELPCVIESLKSWNKKDWVKTADVCQMLLVLGRVNSEEEAKKLPRPKTVEPDTHRYAHGLTPPMHHVRGRRFRPRKSYHDVERIESQANALLQEDEQAVATKYELIDSEGEETSGDESFDGQDAQGEDEDMFEYAGTPVDETVDEDELHKMLQDGLMDDENDGIQLQNAEGHTVDLEDLFGDGDGDDATVEVETPLATSHDVAMHALTQNAHIVLEPESTASTPAAATSPEDDDDDDGDDDDEDEEDDPEAAAKAEQDEQIRAEIRELEDAIAQARTSLATTSNILWRRRLQDRIEAQEKDRLVKLSLLGEQAEDD